MSKSSSKSNKKAQTIVSIASVVVGAIVLVLAGVLGWVVVPDIIEDKVKDETRLTPESDTWEKWVDLPVPINLQVYFFNVTNYEAFEGKDDWSTDPVIEEVGPWVWSERRIKYDIREGPNDTLFYRQNITYVFNETLSGGRKPDDLVTIVNIPFITAITLLDIWPQVRPLAPTVFQSLLAQNESIIARGMKVQDVMFDGVQLKPIYRTVETVARGLGIPLPDEFLNGVFAFYRGKNGLNSEGVYQVNRGIKDSSLFSVLKSINNGKTSLEPWWYGPCAMINGTDGTMFPPFIEKSSNLQIYVPEICRSIYVEYDSETEYEGIPGYRFKLPTKLFQGPHVNPDNQCFCITPMWPMNDTCSFNGMGRLFSCKANVPIAISKPHFLDADDFVVEIAQRFGLNPERSKHDTYLDVEPNTGFPLRVHKRLQVGAEIQSYLSNHPYQKPPFNTIPHMIYPVFWADESAELDDELVDEIKSKLIKPLNLVKIGKWTLVGVGAFLTVAGVLFFGYVRFIKK